MKEPSQGSVLSGLPSDLNKMQGRWVSIGEGSSVQTVVQGYTVRLTYDRAGDGLRCKRNVSIREFVPVQGLFEVHGDTQPWFYYLHDNEGIQELDLRFFDETHHQWISSHLQRQVKPGRMAAL
ncbi:hypothetical protein P4B35_02915 [Pontiellaceae bacterium B12227]|nr:hypothetical protein [Pontiellaceae bacterium B12227]